MATRRVLLALLLSAASTASATDPDHYSPAERDEAVDRALHGDGRASSDVSMYYAYKMFDAQESQFWLKLSAEQGYCEGIISMAGLMDNHHDHEQVNKWVGVAKARHCEREDERIARDIVLFGNESKAPPAAPSQGEQAYDLSSTFDLDAAELERIRQLAVRGDAAASHRISDYYLWGYNQVEEGWFWLRLAAEQGDCDAAVGYAGQAEGPMRRPEVATRWLDRAEAMGCAKDPRNKEFIEGLRESISSRVDPGQSRRP